MSVGRRATAGLCRLRFLQEGAVARVIPHPNQKYRHLALPRSLHVARCRTLASVQLGQKSRGKERRGLVERGRPPHVRPLDVLHRHSPQLHSPQLHVPHRHSPMPRGRWGPSRHKHTHPGRSRPMPLPSAPRHPLQRRRGPHTLALRTDPRCDPHPESACAPALRFHRPSLDAPGGAACDSGS